jgi:hypothetical protein
VLIIVACGISAMGVVGMALLVGRAPQVLRQLHARVEDRRRSAELEPGGVIGQFFEPPPTVRSVVESLRKAKVDRRVRA